MACAKDTRISTTERKLVLTKDIDDLRDSQLPHLHKTATERLPLHVSIHQAAAACMSLHQAAVEPSSSRGTFCRTKMEQKMCSCAAASCLLHIALPTGVRPGGFSAWISSYWTRLCETKTVRLMRIKKNREIGTHI